MLETPNNFCPNCKKTMDSATSIDRDNHKPIPGDISICLYCQSLLIFDDNLMSQNPTQEQIDELKSDPELWNKIHKVRYVIKKTL